MIWTSKPLILLSSSTSLYSYSCFIHRPPITDASSPSSIPHVSFSPHVPHISLSTSVPILCLIISLISQALFLVNQISSAPMIQNVDTQTDINNILTSEKDSSTAVAATEELLSIMCWQPLYEVSCKPRAICLSSGQVYCTCHMTWNVVWHVICINWQTVQHISWLTVTHSITASTCEYHNALCQGKIPPSAYHVPCDTYLVVCYVVKSDCKSDISLCMT